MLPKKNRVIVFFLTRSYSLRRTRLSRRSLIQQLPSLPIRLHRGKSNSRRRLSVTNTHLHPMSFRRHSNRFSRPRHFKTLNRRRITRITIRSHHRNLPQGTFQRRHIRHSRRVSMITYRRRLHGTRVNIMVRRIRHLNRITMIRHHTTRQRNLIRRQRNITRTTINFLHSRIRQLFINQSILLPNSMFRMFSTILSTSTIRIMGLTPQRSNQGSLIFLNHHRSRSNIYKQLFRHLRRNIRNYNQRRISLISSRCQMATRLQSSTRLLSRHTSILRQIIQYNIRLISIRQTTLIRQTTQFTLITNFYTIKTRTISNLYGSTNTNNLSRTTKATRRMNVNRLNTLSNIFRHQNGVFLPSSQNRNHKTMFTYTSSGVARDSTGVEGVDRSLGVQSWGLSPPPSLHTHPPLHRVNTF